MGNCLFCWPDRLQVSASYTPILSGGSWSASLPLLNLQNLALSRKARSVDATTAATQFSVDLGVSRSIRAISIMRHNLSSAATVRVRGYSDAGHTTLVWDSTALSIWPEGYPTAEDKKRYQEDFHIILSASQSFRYPLVEISDTANPAGYVELARCMFFPAFQPAVNMSYGAGLGLETDTSKERSLAGTDFWDRKEPRRTVRFTLPVLSESEAFNDLLDLQWDRGIDREVLFVFNPDDAGLLLKKRTFLMTIRQLTAIEFPYGTNHTTGFEGGEVL